jgi:Short C-terminal domain
MGMMRRRMRRRAIVGGAAAAGLAYHAGKSRGRGEAGAGEEQYEEEPADPPYAPPPPSPPVADSSPYDDLEHLGKLHEDGVLTDEEFSQAKAKVLGS